MPGLGPGFAVAFFLCACVIKPFFTGLAGFAEDFACAAALADGFVLDCLVALGADDGGAPFFGAAAGAAERVAKPARNRRCMTLSFHQVFCMVVLYGRFRLLTLHSTNAAADRRGMADAEEARLIAAMERKANAEFEKKRKEALERAQRSGKGINFQLSDEGAKRQPAQVRHHELSHEATTSSGAQPVAYKPTPSHQDPATTPGLELNKYMDQQAQRDREFRERQEQAEREKQAALAGFGSSLNKYEEEARKRDLEAQRKREEEARARQEELQAQAAKLANYRDKQAAEEAEFRRRHEEAERHKQVRASLFDSEGGWARSRNGALLKFFFPTHSSFRHIGNSQCYESGGRATSPGCTCTRGGRKGALARVAHFGISSKQLRRLPEGPAREERRERKGQELLLCMLHRRTGGRVLRLRQADHHRRHDEGQQQKVPPRLPPLRQV